MSKIAVTRSSGNVFADLGLPDAKELAVKPDLVIRIMKIMKSEGLTQTETAKRIGMSQGDLSKVLRGHFREYSIKQLTRLAELLDH